MARLRFAIRNRLNEVRRLFWQDIDPIVQIAAVSLLVIGVVLMALGFLADATGFWNGASFSPNIVSSLASACFGIPLALVFLRYLIDQQEERSAKRAALRLATATAKRFVDLGDSLIRDHDTLERARVDLFICWLWRGEQDLFPYGPVIKRMVRDYKHRSSTLNDVSIEPNLLSAYQRFEDAIVPPPERARIVHEMSATWRYLDETVRPKLLESGLNWLSSETVTKLRQVSWDPFEDDSRGPGAKSYNKGDGAYALLSSDLQPKPRNRYRARLDLADALISRSAALQRIEEVVGEIRDQMVTDY